MAHMEMGERLKVVVLGTSGQPGCRTGISILPIIAASGPKSHTHYSTIQPKTQYSPASELIINNDATAKPAFLSDQYQLVH